MVPLRGFRFLQVGGGPVERRAGTLLALLGAEVVALLDDAAAGRVLTDPSAPNHAGRLVVVADPADAGRVPHAGIIDGSGRVPSGPTIVSVAGCLTGPVGWAASGAMALTGPTHGAARLAPGDQAAGMAAAAAVLALLTDLGGHRVELDGAALTGERAALTGLGRHGAISPGGSCRLLAAEDGWVAVNLPRRCDLDLVAAWLGEPAGVDPWATVQRLVSARPTAVIVTAGQELGLAVSAAVSPRQAAGDAQALARGQSFPMRPFLADGLVPPLEPARRAPSTVGLDPPPARPRPLASRRVVDFSSLWAGPLATSLLAEAGAEVVKVESTSRPDGARSGEPRFFALLNAGKRSVALDFGAPTAPAQLAALIDGAEVVVEASRPRAFEQLGLEPDAWQRAHPDGTWMSITAYGRSGPRRQWSGFGDDATPAGGLVIQTPTEGPLLCADAYADPTTGLHAAVVATAGLVGTGGTFDLALREVVNHLLAETPEGEMVGMFEMGERPELPVAPPRARVPRGPAAELGEANNEMLGGSAPGHERTVGGGGPNSGAADYETARTSTLERPVTTIITLCTGNAARSVMAGAILTHAAPDLRVITAGTHVIDGQPMSWRTREALAALGLEANHHRSAQLRPVDLPDTDLVLAMAGEHVRYMRREHPEVADRTATLKRLVRDLPAGPEPLVERLSGLDLAAHDPTEEEDVADPAGGSDVDYVHCAREINDLLGELLPRL